MSTPRKPAPSEDMIVCVYEDGTRCTCTLREWQAANLEDPETAAALVRLTAGETVSAGGGAAPLCKLWIEQEASPYVN